MFKFKKKFDRKPITVMRNMDIGTESLCKKKCLNKPVRRRKNSRIAKTNIPVLSKMIVWTSVNGVLKTLWIDLLIELVLTATQ